MCTGACTGGLMGATTGEGATVGGLYLAARGPYGLKNVQAWGLGWGEVRVADVGGGLFGRGWGSTS